jgi:hypothetical protein
MKNKIIIILLLISISFGQDLIGEGLYGEELIQFLKGNYQTSTTLGYTDARDTLYLRIDRIDGEVRGVYTNYSVELPFGVDPSTHLYENGINCEHIWPQSMYEGGDPMKSDMHALRPCKDNINSARGNKPFNEINDEQTTTWYWLNSQSSSIPSSNIEEYSENHGSYFEPREDRKGDISRTIFYFYTMYSEFSDEYFFDEQKEILKNWHLQDSSNDDEIERTWQIAEYQQNKPNPFILDDTLIDRAYFHNGFTLGDINEDGNIDVLDIVGLVNQILDGGINPMGDMNGDGENNILDVVILAGIILS